MEIKFNLGCGIESKAGYTNVDIRALPGVDLVADITQSLPGILPGSVDRIEAYDVLEHIEQGGTVAALALWISYLRRGGILVVRVPDIQAIATDYLGGVLPIYTAQHLLYGGQSNEYDFHKCGFDGSYLEGLIMAAGCRKILQRLPRDCGYNVTIVAEK